ESLSAYISLVKRHIHQEDHRFFPLIEKSLTGDEIKGIVSYFENEEKHFRENKEFGSSLSILKSIQNPGDGLP
ncbi:MAG: hypothetical protein AB1659_03610, partial [Thermodesulfobacteriota bacterium]